MLRAIVLIVGVTEAAVLLAFIWIMLQSSDPIARSIGTGMATFAAIPLLFLVTPALVLGFRRRALRLALLLEVAAVIVATVFWRLA